MTEHADVTGQDIIRLKQDIGDGAFSLHSLEAVSKHVHGNRGHQMRLDTDQATVEISRHLQALLRGEVSASDLELQA